MVTAIMLFNVERTRINAVAEQLVEMSSVSEVYSVSGNFDLVAVIRVKSNEELADFVTRELHDVGGIEHTETMLAFKAYSQHDLESMFSI